MSDTPAHWQSTRIGTSDFPEVSTDQIRVRFNHLNGRINHGRRDNDANERAEIVRLQLELMRREA